MIVVRNPTGSSNSAPVNNYNSNEDEVQVNSGEISYYIVNIYPTNNYFIDQTTELGIA